MLSQQGCFQRYSLLGTLSNMFEQLEAKRSVVIHTMTKQNAHFKLINEARTLTIEHSVFFVMAGLIVEMLFILFSAYNIV